MAGIPDDASSSDEDEALTPAWPSPQSHHHSMHMERPEVEGFDGQGSPSSSPPRQVPTQEDEVGVGWAGRRQKEEGRYEGRRKQVEEEEEAMWARLMPTNRAAGTSPKVSPSGRHPHHARVSFASIHTWA